MYAAAGPLLRKALGPRWRGRRVTVCHAGRCVRVTLNDWCLCSKGRRLIDLSDEAFRRLAPLGRGVIDVTIQGGGT
jgi:rare lipoprotein A (peptidoglycan hydrolase)